MLFLCVISIFDSNIGNHSHRCLKMFVTVEISIDVHLVLKDDLELSKWINRGSHYIQRDQYVQKPWNWRYTGRWEWWCPWSAETGWGSGVISRADWRDMHGLSLEYFVSKNRVNSLQSCLSEDLYNLLFITEYKKQTIGATTYYVLLIYFSPTVGTLWMS